MTPFSGKAVDQPLILTGAHIYDVLDFREEGDNLLVGVSDGAGLADDGEDLAALWEKRAGYLERALTNAEAELDLLFDAILEEEVDLLLV